MHHPINNFFDHVFCINLVESKERRQSATDRFTKLGIDVEFFNATRYGFNKYMFNMFNNNKYNGHDFGNANEVNCSISHYSCIRIAKERGYKSILILEDDVVFLKNFNDIIQSYLDLIPNNWNLVYLYSGLWRWSHQHRWIHGAENKIFTTYDVTGCIAYGIKADMYDAYLEGMDECFQIADNYCSKLQKTFKYNIYSLVPNLCAQPANRSTINPDPAGIVNVFPFMKSFMGKGPNDYE